MNKSKRICELLRICYHDSWYDWDKCPKKHPGNWEDSHFDTDSGRVQLLRLMMEREDWHKFIFNFWGSVGVSRSDVFTFITQDGPLVDAVIEWMEKKQ